MGIFTRVRDIIASNINAMLDKAEDPRKLIKLMIREMEDVLVEVKASCAGAMASQKRVQRAIDEARSRVEEWENRAKLAVEKGREDLAREALAEKRRYAERTESLGAELAEHERLVGQYRDEIAQLEEKLNAAREKQRILVQRHIHAQKKKRAEEGIRKAETSDAFTRLEKLENRIERMEAEADLVNYGRKPSVQEEFEKIEHDEDLERELEELKSRMGRGGASAAPRADEDKDE
jgi:phage shock protein A